MSEAITELAYSKLIDEHMELLDNWKVANEEIERLNNIIKKAKEILERKMAFTSSYQLNYQMELNKEEEALKILNKEKE